MERLLEVQILNNQCQCCFDSFSYRRFPVTNEFREIFCDLFKIELQRGWSLCKACSGSLKRIYDFKKETVLARQHFQNHQVKDIFAIEEHLDELPDENIVKQEETNNFDETNEVQVKTEASKRPKKSNKKTELTKILGKYNVQLVEDTLEDSKKTTKVSCPLCSKVLSLSSLPFHIKGHEGGHEYRFTCEVCGVNKMCNAELIVHRRRHTREKPFQCDHCPSAFFNCKKNLIQHLRTIHLNLRRFSQQLEQCKICYKKFSHVYLINCHMKKAHPSGMDDGVKANVETNQFHCVRCQGQYRNRRYLDNHVCIEGAGDGPTQNACTICSTKCESRIETIKHIQEQHAERLDVNKWKCRVCDTIVLDKIVLHVESVHTKVGSKCVYCNKELKNRRCLRNHIYVVHENGSEIRKQMRKHRKLVKPI